MSESKRCKSCGNPVDLDQAKAHDGACPWCLAAFTFGPEAIPPPPPESSKQFGKYVRTEKLGAGGMGEVWKALDTELNRWVALKFLKEEDPSSAARFQREARTAAGLSHPGIAAIHEVGVVDGRHFIAMQHVQGRTLSGFPRQDRRLLVRLFRDAARALDHAHRHGVIHRDLKPDNLMVEEREDGWQVVILDFGLARPLEGGEKLSKSGEVYGTAAYMSPEQARGEHLDERADVYSLGASLYEVLTGRPPFRGANLLELLRKVATEEPNKPRKLNPRIHRDLETIVLKCLEKDRDRRYPNARELAEDLERFLNSDPILARPPSTLYRLRLHLGKRKAIAASIIIAALAVSTITGLWAWHWRPRQEQARLYREGLDLREEMLRMSFAPKMERTRLARRAAEARRLFELANEHLETPAAHIMRGRCFQIEGKREEALAAFERSCTLKPDDVVAKIELARGLLLKYRDLRQLTMTLWFRDRGVLTHQVRMNPETDETRRLRERIEHLLEGRDVQGPKRDLLLGLLAYGRGEYPKAADCLGRYLLEDGLDLEAMELEFDARFFGHDLATLIKSSERFMTLAPNAFRWIRLGRARHQTGDLKGAIADYTRALAMEPTLTTALQARGFSHSTLNDHKAALLDFDRLVQIDPKSSNAYSLRGIERYYLDDLMGSMADHDEAVRLNPRNSSAYIDRSGTRMAFEDFEGVIADTTQGLKLDPTQQAGYLVRGQARMKLGQVREAADDFTEGLKHDPSHSTLYFHRGEVRLVLRETAAGLDDLAKAIEVAGGTASAYYTRGRVFQELGDEERAFPDFQKAIDLDSRTGPAWVGLGQIHFGRGALDKAEADFEKAIECNPRDSDALHLRGEVRAERDDVKGALDDWKRSLESCRPENHLLRAHLENHLLEVKEYGHRWSDVSRAKRDFMKAHQLHLEKRYDAAIEILRRIVESIPKSETARVSAYNISCAFARLEDKEKALEWLEASADKGYAEWRNISVDPDMELLREEQRYLVVLERMKKKAKPPPRAP